MIFSLLRVTADAEGGLKNRAHQRPVLQGFGGGKPPTSERRVYTGALLAVTDSPLFRLKHFDCPGQKLRHADTFAGSVCLNTVGNLRLDLRGNLLVILFVVAVFDRAACVRFSPFFHGASLKKRGGGKYRPFAFSLADLLSDP